MSLLFLLENATGNKAREQDLEREDIETRLDLGTLLDLFMNSQLYYTA